jgi:hypothetical protein
MFVRSSQSLKLARRTFASTAAPTGKSALNDTAATAAGKSCYVTIDWKISEKVKWQ